MKEANAPLVSVLMPAYNASGTILTALSSLLAQSYKNWECIIVDDGSTDNTIDMISMVNDPRVKVYSLDKNYGRGVARKNSLDLANGKYITMLDADDWLYPHKIFLQVEFLENNPEISLHSMGMAISCGNILHSVRASNDNIDCELKGLSQINIPHAPSMIRRSSIGSINYNTKLKFAQDQDFLRKVVFGKRYYISPEVGYCYSEIDSVGITKIIKSYYYSSKGLMSAISSFGPQAFFLSILELCKIPYVLMLCVVKGERYIIDSRSSSPSDEETIRYNKSYNRIKYYCSQISNGE